MTFYLAKPGPFFRLPPGHPHVEVLAIGSAVAAASRRSRAAEQRDHLQRGAWERIGWWVKVG